MVCLGECKQDEAGCGKSETWRCLSKEYPGLIRIIDFSRMSADGWKGSLHLRDIFTGIDPDDLRRRGLIVVLDEADKILCEHALGARRIGFSTAPKTDPGSHKNISYDDLIHAGMRREVAGRVNKIVALAEQAIRSQLGVRWMRPCLALCTKVC